MINGTKKFCTELLPVIIHLKIKLCLFVLCFQLKKEVEELTAKLGQQTSQENKEGNNSDGSGKEEDASNSLPGSTQVGFITTIYKFLNQKMISIFQILHIIVIYHRFSARSPIIISVYVFYQYLGKQIKEESGVTIKREAGGDEEVETIEVGEGEGIKGTPDSLTLTSPTLKKEKDIKREKDIKKESIKPEHRDPAHRAKDAKMAESELVRDLKAQLKYV